jgi:MtN3 and saliva related transmembrane protein
LNRIEWVGFMAGTLTTVAFVPQLLQVWRSRSAHDINLGTFCLFSVGVALWLAYGILLGALAVIISNAVTLALACAILVLKIHFTRLERAAGQLPDKKE